MRDPAVALAEHPSVLQDRLWDVVVVGSGPAGSMAAHQLRGRGLEVVLLDRQAFPRWKVCGACLSPGAQEVLSRAGLGDLPAALGARPLEVLRLKGWSHEALISLKGSVSVSRGSLDTALMEAARSRGVRFLPRARARLETVTPEAAHLRVELPAQTLALRARVVVAADGLRSPILSQASPGAPEPNLAGAGGGKVGLGAVFEEADPRYGNGVIHMAVGEDGYVGLVRTEDGRLNVAAAVKPSTVGRGSPPDRIVAALLRSAGFPPLGAPPSEGWRGTPNLAYRPRRLGGERVFAVGDAAGYVEPFTGEGMSWALAGACTLAPIAARAVEGWADRHLREWETRYRRTVGRSQRLCRGVAWTLGRPRLSRVALHLLKHLPGVAGPFVARAASPPLLTAGRAS